MPLRRVNLGRLYLATVICGVICVVQRGQAGNADTNINQTATGTNLEIENVLKEVLNETDNNNSAYKRLLHNFPDLFQVILSVFDDSHNANGLLVGIDELCAITKSHLEMTRKVCEPRESTRSNTSNCDGDPLKWPPASRGFCTVLQKTTMFKQPFLLPFSELKTETNKTANISSSYLLSATNVVAEVVLLITIRCHMKIGTFGAGCNKMNAAFNFSSFQDDNASYVLYFDHLEQKRNGSSSSNWLIGIVGNSCSMLSSVLLIGGYFFVKANFSMPDKIITCLSGCLFVCHAVQLLLALFSSNKTFCEIFRILLHWTLLVVFFWTMALSIHLFVTFKKLRPVQPESQSNNRFAKQFIAIASTATALTLITRLFGMLPGKDFSGFGSVNKCFVSKFWPHLFGFSVPVGIVMVVNTVFLVMTIYNIHSTTKQINNQILPPNACNSSRKKIVPVILTLKLSTLMGLGWTLGFAQGLVYNATLSTCFTIVVSFHGTLLFLAFGHHRKMFNAFRKFIVVGRKNSNTDLTSVARNRQTQTTKL
eukprot:gene12884-14210_t